MLVDLRVYRSQLVSVTRNLETKRTDGTASTEHLASRKVHFPAADMVLRRGREIPVGW